MTFFGKNLLRFWEQKGPKWAQNVAFQVLQKTDKVFLIFAKSYRNIFKLKIGLKNFFWEKPCFEVYRLKGLKTGPK